MDAVNIFRHWTHEHHLSSHDIKEFSGRVVHNPAFWTIIALLAFIALLIVLAILSGGSTNGQVYFPRHTPYSWPIMP